jgi:hypothetical protein
LRWRRDDFDQIGDGASRQFWPVKKEETTMSTNMERGDRVDVRVFSLSILLLAGVVGPLPLIPVLIILAWSLMRWLKADFAHLEDHQHLIAHQPPKHGAPLQNFAKRCPQTLRGKLLPFAQGAGAPPHLLRPKACVRLPF